MLLVVTIHPIRSNCPPYLQLEFAVCLPPRLAALAIYCAHIDKFLSSSFPVKDPLDRNQTSINRACPCNSAPKSDFNSLLVFISAACCFVPSMQLRACHNSEIIVLS
ncbi:hypothetical protein C2845_PM10G02690 [Panicum miliaceum]|uniref:Uncharacterized protein n=1 Tax=Panicum miliaceum TaxID=4540 RepID=A0A3L6PEJ8_PANMI|nr:hypothetical protein C2845_PM10G02690 [Panicum miliaceum]